MQPHPEHAIAYPPNGSVKPTGFRVQPLDWFTPVIFAVALWAFGGIPHVARNTIAGFDFAASGLAYGAIGLVIFGATFALARAKSSPSRLGGGAIACAALLLSFAVPSVTFWAYNPWGEPWRVWVLLSLNAVIMAGLIASWFVLRGFPKASLAWVVLVPFAIFIVDALWRIALYAAIPSAFDFDGPLRTLITIFMDVLCFAAAMVPANAVANTLARIGQPRGPQTFVSNAYGGTPYENRTNVVAIFAFACSFVFSIGAIILGHLALSSISKSYQRGKGLAFAGLVLGYAGLLASTAFALQTLITSGVLFY